MLTGRRCESLRKFRLPGVRVVLLAQQAHVIPQREQSLEDPACLVVVPATRECTASNCNRKTRLAGGSPRVTARVDSGQEAVGSRVAADVSIVPVTADRSRDEAREGSVSSSRPRPKAVNGRRVESGESLSRTSARIAPRIARQLRPPLRPNFSTAATERSNATHAMTVEWVKCRRGRGPPRSRRPVPSNPFEKSHQGQLHAPGSSLGGSPRRASEQDVHHSP